MTEEEKNLGVFVDLKMTANSQYEAALMKSTYQLRYFQENGKTLMTLYKALLQPSLELHMQLWSLLIKGDKLKM